MNIIIIYLIYCLVVVCVYVDVKTLDISVFCFNPDTGTSCILVIKIYLSLVHLTFYQLKICSYYLKLLSTLFKIPKFHRCNKQSVGKPLINELLVVKQPSTLTLIKESLHYTCEGIQSPDLVLVWWWPVGKYMDLLPCHIFLLLLSVRCSDCIQCYSCNYNSTQVSPV